MINQASRPGLCRVRSVVALVIAILTSVVAVVPVPARAGAEVFASIGTERGMARWTADRAVDMIRNRFGWDAVGYGSVVLGPSRSVPDEFRELAEKDL